MKLNEIRKEISYYSEKAGAVNQKLALAGVAIIWLFKETAKDEIQLDLWLIISLALFIFSLGIDLIHYAVFAPIYRNYYNKNETKAKTGNGTIIEDTEVGEPSKTNDLSWVFFFTKIGLTIIGYIIICLNLFNKFVTL